MSRGKKYQGGSKLRSFRLPIVGYEQAEVRIQALLDSIASESVNDVHASCYMNSTNLANIVSNELGNDINYIRYYCGCAMTNDTFRKAIGCRIARVDHR